MYRSATRKLVFLACSAFLFGACDNTTTTDAGVLVDAGSRTDAGTTGVDAGPTGMDAGPGDDAGPGVDAGDAVDAGADAAVPTDAGDVDAAAPSDAGPGMDAATMTDAGPAMDAGATDAATGTPDGGAPDAAVIPCSPDSDLGSMTGASVSTGTTVGEGDDATGSCGDSPSGADLAFTWRAPSTGTWAFHTFGSDFDTVIHLHMGSDCSTATETACNDDYRSLQSRVDADLMAGDMITIVVEGYGATDEGNYVLGIEAAPVDVTEILTCNDSMDNDLDGTTDCDDFDCFTRAPCDTCPEAAIPAIGMGVATGSTVGRVDRRFGSCSDFGASDITFSFTAPSDGAYTIDTTGSDFDTVLYILSGGCNGREIACNDDDPAGGSTSALTVDLAAGEEIVIVVDGFVSILGGAPAEGMVSVNIATAAMTYGPPTTAGDLVITEVLQNPSGSDVGFEWFEIVNTTATTLNLNGCRVFDAGTNTFTIGRDALIRPGEFFTFASSATPGFVPGFVFSVSRLGNDDDEIIIECGGTPVEIDRVEWDGGPMFPDPNGLSMNLDPAATDATMNDTGSNWCDSPLPVAFSYDGVNAGTPGQSNLSCP